MLTVRATLTNGMLKFQPPFTPPSQEAEVLVTFVEKPTEDRQEASPGLLSDQFRWDETRARITDLGGKPASQICIEDRDDDWR